MYTFSHIHIFCRDLSGMIRFWRDGLGAEFVKLRQFGDKQGAVLRCGSVQINIKEEPAAGAAQSGNAGIDHIAFFADDVDAALTRMTGEFGCTLERWTPGKAAAFIRGPEGLLIEIMKPGPR